MKLNKVFFILILALSILLRFWNFPNVPPSPDWDEVAIGWNAYSLIETGQDEFGKRLPLTFRSFDDYKPPFYFYLTVPFVKVFGLNVFAVRLPSAVFGVFSVIGTYLLVKKLFAEETVSLLAMFFMAVSPWHLQFSRIAFEANVALALEIWGTYLFLCFIGEANNKIFSKKTLLIILSALLFGLAMYTYHSARVFVPLLVLSLSLFNWRKLWKARKKVLLGIVVGMVFVVPLVRIMTSKQGQMRLKAVSSFSNTIDLLREDTIRMEQDLEKGFVPGRLIHNRRIRFALRFLQSYFAHWDLNWLFVNGEGDVPRHHVPDVGLLYLWELPFILIGIYQLFFSERKKAKQAVFSWFLLAPVAAAVSADAPHGVRTLCMLPTWHVFTALGVLKTHQYLKSKKELCKYLGYFAIGSGFIFNFVFYLHQYHVHQPLEYSRFWQYGYKQLYNELEKLEPEYEEIRVSIEAEQPYMFYLFYSKYPPQKYLEAGGTKSGGFWEEHGLGKYQFIRFNWSEEPRQRNTLWAVVDKELPSDVEVLKTIKLKNGEPYLHIFKLK
jgi:4-amino-4-deoxy-L-arabinose transferase-like glycosyltransferase